MFGWKLLATAQHCMSVARVCPGMGSVSCLPVYHLCVGAVAWMCFSRNSDPTVCQRMNGIKERCYFQISFFSQVFEQLVALWHLRALHPKMHNCCRIIWNLMIFQWQRVIQSRAYRFSAICCKLGFWGKCFVWRGCKFPCIFRQHQQQQQTSINSRTQTSYLVQFYNVIEFNVLTCREVHHRCRPRETIAPWKHRHPPPLVICHTEASPVVPIQHVPM